MLTTMAAPGSAKPVNAGDAVVTELPAAGCCKTGVFGFANTVNAIAELDDD